jgi:LDH2 family malate/lactate/ureidoglycolate dehydrogenase
MAVSTLPVTVGVEALEDFTRRVFSVAGMPPEDAAVMADKLVGAHLRGFDTHGVNCIPNYVANLREGRVAAWPDIRLERRALWAWAVDGGNGMGHVVADRAMTAVIGSVREIGIGIASVRQSTHFGAACLYPLMAAEQGFIGMTLANMAPHVAPWGSREQLFGTNPLAIAVPAGKRPPFVLDMATSAAARRKFRMALELGEPIPEGWALDADGNPTTDPAAAMEGVALPMGGAKGSGLGMMVEILAGVLSGAHFAGEVLDMYTNYGRPADSGNFLLALDPSVFLPVDDFARRMDDLIDRLKALEAAPGFDEVRFPGERGARLAEERRRDGIPLTTATAEELRKLAGEMNLAFPA